MLLLFTIIIIIIIIFITIFNKNEYVKSDIDGKSYKVRKEQDKLKAADYLANLYSIILSFITKLKLKYKGNKNIKRLYNRFKYCNFVENTKDSKYTTYTQNKCQQMKICIRHKGDNSFIDKNIVIFVIIHELAHVMSLQYDPKHETTEFWDNFKFLLNKAIEYNVWDYEDYNINPVKYCGINISYLPFNN